MEEDYEQSRLEAQAERAQRRAELFLPVSSHVANLSSTDRFKIGETGDEDDLKFVEEIESLCMNCHLDVCPSHIYPHVSFSKHSCIGNDASTLD